jgi:hypothetical protein
MGCCLRIDTPHDDEEDPLNVVMGEVVGVGRTASGALLLFYPKGKTLQVVWDDNHGMGIMPIRFHEC